MPRRYKKASEMTEREIKDLMYQWGYKVDAVLATYEWWLVYDDGCNGLRLKDMRRHYFQGLQGGFYDNHNGLGETAVEAAITAAKRLEAKEVAK